MLGSGQAAPAPGAATQEPAPAEPAPAAEPSELSALSLAGSVIAGRLRDPRTLALALFTAALVGYRLGRGRHR
jgi:hypothetical protein